MEPDQSLRTRTSSRPLSRQKNGKRYLKSVISEMLTTRQSVRANKEEVYTQADAQHGFEYRRSSCYRRNVLDLLHWFGGRAKTAYLFCDVDMQAIENDRQIHNVEGHSLTVTAYLIKAIAIAQLSHSISRTFCLPFGRLVTFNDVVAGFTVEREVAGEPIVFFAEIEKPHLKSLEELAAVLKEYATGDLFVVPKLRQQMIFARFPWFVRQIILLCGLCFPALRLVCMRATFGLSSLGSLGVAFVCGPSVCTSVFGVGAIESKVVVRNGELMVRPMMSLSLSYDLNVMGCEDAARFLQTIKNFLECCGERLR